MKTVNVGCADVHPGTLPDRLQALKNLDVRGGIGRFVDLVYCHNKCRQSKKIPPPAELWKIGTAPCLSILALLIISFQLYFYPPHVHWNMTLGNCRSRDSTRRRGFTFD